MFSSLSLLLYESRADSVKREKKKDVPKVNRMMAVRFVQRHANRGEQPGDVVVLNVHLNNCIAKKAVQNPTETLARFWDRMCSYIMK